MACAERASHENKRDYFYTIKRMLDNRDERSLFLAGAHGTSMQIAEAMLEAGVVTVPGAAFGKECENYLRVSFYADKAALTEGARRMKEALKSL